MNNPATTTRQPPVHHRFPVYRRHGLPHKLWNDDIYNFIQTTPHQSTDNVPNSATTSLQIAADPPKWRQLEDKFVDYMKKINKP